jgi:hypothetical protein
MGGSGMSAAHPLRERRAVMLEDLQRNVPHELRELSAWLLFRLEPKAGKPGEWDKVPYYASGAKRHGRQGSPEDAEHLTDFPAAMAALTGQRGAWFDGVGLALLPCHDVTALDLDKLDADPARAELAVAVLDSGTYCETSPSGNGLRAFFAGKAGFGNVKNNAAGVEVFESSGFVTVTGAEVSSGADLAPMPDALRARLAAVLSKPKERAAPKSQPGAVAFDLGRLPWPLAQKMRAGFPSGSDRSAALYWRALELRRAGLTDAETLAVLGDPELPWIVPALERRGGDIESARDWLWRYAVQPAYSQPLEVPPTGNTAPAAWDVEPLDFLRQTVAPAFDADDVPAELGRFACEWAAAAGFDPSGLIVATVGAAAAALSDGLRLEVNRASQHYESARLWVLLIGPPGVAKSPSLAQASAPLKDMHRELFEEWQRACARERAAAETSKEPPELPARPALYTMDATTEALAELLAANPRGLLTIYDELDSWLGGHDAYRTGGSKDRGEWLRAYDGGPHQVDRIKRGAFYVPNWGVSILAATTPAALQRHARKLPADGLLQRFVPVLVQPGGKADRRADVSLLARDYYNTLHRLYTYGPAAGVRVVSMTHEAAELLHAERERLRSLALAVQVYGDGFAGHVAKHAGMLARIALTFHAVTGREHPADKPLEAGSVELAARFLRKAFRQAQALYGDLLGRDGAVTIARAVAAVLVADKWLDVTRRDLARGCHAWRKADERERDEAMRFLVDVGWLREEAGQYTKAHATRWAVNPAALERFAEHGEQHRQRRREVVEAIRAASDEK